MDITTVNVADTTATLKEKIKIPGVTLQWKIKSVKFVGLLFTTSMPCGITDEVAKTIACSFVTSRLDYANSVMYGISAKNIHRLQRMQNALARVVLGSSASKFSHYSTNVLCHLHWLPVQYRIQFKL